MQVEYLNKLSIHFELINGADLICIPQVIDNLRNSYRLKSRINCCVGSNAIKQIPTGIKIIDFPEFSIMSNTPGVSTINMFVEANCETDNDLLNECGIVTLGPKIINKYYNLESNGEIIVTLLNTTKDLFYIDQGDDISIITFNIKPLVEFTVNPNTMMLPRN